MAQISLTISRWRMLRLALKKKQSRFEDLRSMARRDQDDVDWLVSNGLMSKVGDGVYELTEKGRESSDLGYFDWIPPRQAAKASAAPAAKGAKKKATK